MYMKYFPQFISSFVLWNIIIVIFNESLSNEMLFKNSDCLHCKIRPSALSFNLSSNKWHTAFSVDSCKSLSLCEPQGPHWLLRNKAGKSWHRVSIDKYGWN